MAGVKLHFLHYYPSRYHLATAREVGMEYGSGQPSHSLLVQLATAVYEGPSKECRYKMGKGVGVQWYLKPDS